MVTARPSPLEVDKCLYEWDRMENYVLQESSLLKLFTITYPLNSSMDDILIKVCSLNDFYSTNIFSPFTVAKHILSLNIDKRLNEGDLFLVNDMAEVTMTGGKKRNFYSFASKYCSHHKPEIFPIYDSFAEKMLIWYRKLDQFYQFEKQDLKQYTKYVTVLYKFKDFYGLGAYDLKQIDKYLWIRGKEYFSKPA